MEANIENNKTNMWHKITSRLEHWHKVALFLIIYDVAVVMGSYFLALWLRFDCRFSQIPDWYLTPWLKFAPIYGVISVIVFWRLHDIANCVREIASE